MKDNADLQNREPWGLPKNVGKRKQLEIHRQHMHVPQGAQNTRRRNNKLYQWTIHADVTGPVTIAIKIAMIGSVLLLKCQQILRPSLLLRNNSTNVFSASK